MTRPDNPGPGRPDRPGPGTGTIACEPGSAMADREMDSGHDRERVRGEGERSPGGGPRFQGQGDLPPDGEIRCKLERADGSEWTVTDLLLTPEGLFINAYRYVRERGLGAESRREVLEREPLFTTDRINCLSRRGTVRWSLTSPAPDGEIR